MADCMAASVDLVAKALGYYRDPLRYPELQRVELPEGMDVLLRIAAGSPGSAEPFVQSTGAAVDDLRKAAEFFVQQTLFCRGASHYRVLGLHPGADPTQVREHYRLLMKLFHPDRAKVVDSWVDSYARRVNEAYNVLRRPESRRVYDTALHAGETAETVAWLPMRTLGVKYGPGHWLPPVPLLLMNHLPAAVLGGTALLAGLFVFGVYLSSGKGGRLEESKRSIPTTVAADRNDAGIGPLPATTPEVSPAVDHTKRDEKPVARQAGTGPMADRTKPEPDKRTVVVQSETSDDRYLEPNPRAAQERQQPDHGPAIQTLVVRARRGGESVDREDAAARRWTEATGRAEPVHDVGRREGDQAPEVQETAGEGLEEERQPHLSRLHTIAASDKGRQTVTVGPSVQPASAVIAGDAPSISPQELENLTGHFTSAYERGDLTGFMALFSANARATGCDNLSEIRRDYADLFHASGSREIRLNDLRWSRRGGFASGDASVAVSVWQRDRSYVNRWAGTIRFEVQKLDGKVLITGLYHDLR